MREVCFGQIVKNLHADRPRRVKVRQGRGDLVALLYGVKANMRRALTEWEPSPVGDIRGRGQASLGRSPTERSSEAAAMIARNSSKISGWRPRM